MSSIIYIYYTNYKNYIIVRIGSVFAKWHSWCQKFGWAGCAKNSKSWL